MKFGSFTIPEEHVISKTKFSYIYTNLRPFLPYHILVSPISCKPFLSDLTIEEYSDLFECVRLCLIGLKNYGTSFTISIQDGKEAGQSVPHVHVHIIPRNENDLIDNDMIYAKGALDIIREDRSFEEMADEVKILRKDFDILFN